MRFVSLAQESIIDISIFGATPFFKNFFRHRFQGLDCLICKFIRTLRFRYRTQPDMYGSGGQGMKWKLFTESWQRMRVFRMAEGDSGCEMPPKRERAIVYYMCACVHYNSERRPRSNFRKTRVPRHKSRKTFFPRRTASATAVAARQRDGDCRTTHTTRSSKSRTRSTAARSRRSSARANRT